MKKQKAIKKGKFDFSVPLAKLSTQGRAGTGFSQTVVAAKTGVDKRIIMNIENGEGNPTLEKLIPVIQLYGVDPRPIFCPEMDSADPFRTNLRLLLETCSEKEAMALIPIMRSILDVIRSNGNVLENNT